MTNSVLKLIYVQELKAKNYLNILEEISEEPLQLSILNNEIMDEVSRETFNYDAQLQKLEEFSGIRYTNYKRLLQDFNEKLKQLNLLDDKKKETLIKEFLLFFIFLLGKNKPKFDEIMQEVLTFDKKKIDFNYGTGKNMKKIKNLTEELETLLSEEEEELRIAVPDSIEKENYIIMKEKTVLYLDGYQYKSCFDFKGNLFL